MATYEWDDRTALHMGDGIRSTGVSIPVTPEFMADALFPVSFVTETLDMAMRRFLYPWEFPDRPRFPKLVLFPRLHATRVKADGLRARVTDAWSVLRHGLPEPDGWD